MIAQQIRAAVAASSQLQALLAAGNFEGLALALSDAQPDTTRSLQVEEMFDILFTAGDYPVMKAAQLSGDPRAVLAFGTLADARDLGPGLANLSLPATVALLDGLQQPPALLSADGRAALVAASVARPPGIDWREVKAALEDN